MDETGGSGALGCAWGERDGASQPGPFDSKFQTDCARCGSTMSLAPEPFGSACLEVIYVATLEARMLAWGNLRLLPRLSKRRQEQIADLMDVIHNLPHLLNDWERCDQQRLRRSLLAYDEKWAVAGGVQLAKVYEQTLIRSPATSNRT